MRSLRPSLDATLRAAIAVQIGCPADLSRLSFCRQRARAHCAHPWAQPFGRLSPCKSAVLPICPSTRQICLEQIWMSEGHPQGVRQGRRTSTTAMLSVAGTRWRHKSVRIRFGRPQDARRVCAMEGAHLKSGAIIASTGEKCGLTVMVVVQHANSADMVTVSCMQGQITFSCEAGLSVDNQRARTAL